MLNYLCVFQIAYVIHIFVSITKRFIDLYDNEVRETQG